ncbi:MAG: Rap1a/Tai family immunity protein [Thiohalocapsa sp.]
MLAACLLSSTLAADALAGPSVGALLAACERGLAQDNTGVDAAMCEWYAVPCDCKLTRPGSVLEPWCMPASESIDHAMRAVVGQLRREPDQELPAEQAVPAILGRLYPCPR